ncbi:MAG: acyl-CoA dehydrogenase [Euryarchaeota archaeon]|nr:acyl-CoA dehydrogenase [Euryarchaeota archaeon]
MDLGLSREQQEFQERARELAERVVAPGAAGRDLTSEFPEKVLRELAAAGILGVMVDQRYGGAGRDCVSYVLALEEISRACAATGVVVSVNNSLVCFPIEHFGGEEARQRFLPALCDGTHVGGFCLTEPNAGTDASAQQTTARREGDDYILDGTKIFVTNGLACGAIVVFAMTDRSKGNKGISAFAVDKCSPGVRAGQAEHKMGINASGTSEMLLENARVPASHRLGNEGDGFKVAMTTLDGGRIGIAAQALGIARAAVELSAAHLRENPGKGRSQALQHRVAECATELEAARLLTLRAALTKDLSMQDRSVRYSREAAQAKLFAAETAVRAATAAVQLLGPAGTARSALAERLFRDAKITEIYEGTSEVQKMVVAASLGFR